MHDKVLSLVKKIDRNPPMIDDMIDDMIDEKGRRDLKRILLIQPNLRWIPGNFKTLWEIHPINLCLIAAMVLEQYEIKIIDANIDDLSPESLGKQIEAFMPDVAGITLLTSEYAEVAHIAARVVKTVNTSIVTVLGGIYATQGSKQAGEDPNIDYLVIGEGEFTFPALLAYLQGQARRPEHGLGYWENGKRVLQSMPPFIADLDALPMPAYHLIDYARYTTVLQRIGVDSPRQIPYSRLITSRGCGIGCTFCEIESITGKAFRARSVENVIKEMEYLKEHYKINFIIFDDDNLYISRSRTKALCRAMIDKKLNLQWNAIAVPVFYLSDEILELMRESGCQYVDMAIESGVERVLKEIVHKPVNLSYARAMVNKAKSLGMDVNAHFIIGFPGETWDEIRATIRFAEEIDSDYTKFFIYQPLPNTPLYKKALAEGWLDPALNVVDGLNWSDSAILSDEFTPQDLRVLRAYEWDRINFSDPKKRAKIAGMMQISEAELNKLRRDTLASVVVVTYPAHARETPTRALAMASL